MIVRRLALEDLAGLLALYAELHPSDEALPPADQVHSIWRTLLDGPQYVYIGAFVEGRLVSACNATVIPNLTRGARPYALIENVVTHSEFRLRGYGKAAMEALMEICWSRGCYKIMLLSALQRAEAHGFYAALGFDPRAKQAFVSSARS
jgi:GNAT superfamily N-acetyltransferase